MTAEDFIIADNTRFLRKFFRKHNAKYGRAFFFVDSRKDKPRCVQHNIDILYPVVLEIIAACKVHIFMQCVQRRNQVFPASNPVVRFAYRHIQKKFLEKRLQVLGYLSVIFFFYIFSAVRKDFRLIRIPDFLQVCPNSAGKDFLPVNGNSEISCGRMYLSHLRILVHIWPL